VEPITEPVDATVIERRIRIESDHDTVFKYWVEPARLIRWMGRSATLEAHVGGLFRVDYNGTDIVRGEFVEVDRPHRLVISWGWEAPGDSVPPGASRVEVTFVEESGGTVVTVRHLNLPDDSRASHAEGWDHFLPNLPGAVAAG